jgi:hypothetical protein
LSSRCSARTKPDGKEWGNRRPPRLDLATLHRASLSCFSRRRSSVCLTTFLSLPQIIFMDRDCPVDVARVPNLTVRNGVTAVRRASNPLDLDRSGTSSSCVSFLLLPAPLKCMPDDFPLPSPDHLYGPGQHSGNRRSGCRSDPTQLSRSSKEKRDLPTCNARRPSSSGTCSSFPRAPPPPASAPASPAPTSRRPRSSRDAT